MKRREPTGDGRPPIPVAFLTCDYRSWWDASEPLPFGTPDDPEEVALVRGVSAQRRWKDAALAWGAANGYSRHEMYRAWEAAQGPVVDGAR